MNNEKNELPIWEQTKPILVERYADNGAFSHWDLVDQDGEVVYSQDEDHPINQKQPIPPNVQEAIDWVEVEKEFTKYWLAWSHASDSPQNITEWFKSRLQGVKVEGKPASVEQGEVLSAEQWMKSMHIAEKHMPDNDIEYVFLSDYLKAYGQYLTSRRTGSDAQYNKLLELHMNQVLKYIGGSKSNKTDYWLEYLKDNGLVG